MISAVKISNVRPSESTSIIKNQRPGPGELGSAMSSSEEYTEKPKRLSKRQKLLSEIAGEKWSAKQLEEILSLVKGKGKTDELFALPASSIKTEEQFHLRYGLISLQRAMPPYDRFASIETPESTLRAVYDLIISDVLYSSEFQPPSADGEMQLSAILDRMTRNFGRFTKPRQTAATTSETVKKSDFAMKYPELETADPLPQPTAAADSSSSDEEGLAPEAGSATWSRQHSDVLLYVFKEFHTMHGLLMKIAKDWKTTARVRNIFQPAVYVIDELRETRMKPKVYRPPVYIMVEDVGRWFYGILEVDGFVKIEKQTIVEQSLKDFPASPPEGETVAYKKSKFTQSYNREEVTKMLEVWKEEMLLEQMKVPDGFHPVGRFFIRELESFEMPSVFADRPIGTGAMRYLDGTLKILVGRRVIKWTPDDALEAWQGRQYLERKAGDAARLPKDLWPKFHPNLSV